MRPAGRPKYIEVVLGGDIGSRVAEPRLYLGSISVVALPLDQHLELLGMGTQKIGVLRQAFSGLGFEVVLVEVEVDISEQALLVGCDVHGLDVPTERIGVGLVNALRRYRNHDLFHWLLNLLELDRFCWCGLLLRATDKQQRNCQNSYPDRHQGLTVH